MLKNLISAGCFFLFMACGQAADKTATTSKDTTTVKQPVTEDTIPPGAAAKADTNSNKAVIANPIKAVATFIPDGYTVLDTCSGDLNLDGNTDLLVLLRKNGEETSEYDGTDSSTAKRRLLLLTRVPDHATYKLAAQSDHAVYCYSCGGMLGDPYQRLVIKNGYFSIEHYGGSAWRWSRTITFKYVPADSTWYLHKDGNRSYHATDPDKTETKIHTVKDFGKVPFAQFDIYKDR